MRIEVRVSGGVTGTQMGGAVDTGTLDEELAQRVERHLSPQRLDRAGGSDATGQPDRRQFTVTTQGRQFGLSETELDDEQITVLDAVLTEVARRQRHGGGPEGGHGGDRG